MAPERGLFTESHRRSIGVCVAQLGEALATIRSHVGSAESIARIQAEIASLAAATGAHRPGGPHNPVNAALAQMLVLEEEMRPRRMRAYGDLGEEASRILDEHVQRLVDATRELIREIEELPRGRSAE